MGLIHQLPHLSPEHREAILDHVHASPENMSIVGATLSQTLRNARAAGVIGKKPSALTLVPPPPPAAKTKPRAVTTTTFIGSRRVEVDEGDEPEPEPDDYDEPLELSDFEDTDDETISQETSMSDIERKQKSAERKLQQVKGAAEASAAPRTRSAAGTIIPRAGATAEDQADAEAALAVARAEALAPSYARKAGR